MSPKRRLRVGGYDIDVRLSQAQPGGRTLIMVHGIGASGAYFMPFAEVSAGEYDVHVIDLPGYGVTPKPMLPLDLEQLAEAVAAYIRSLRVGKVTIVGHSMGCQIAAHVAVRHPALCRSLILLGPTVNRGHRSRRMQGVKLLMDTFKEPAAANALLFRSYLQMGMRRYLRTARFMVEDKVEETLSKTAVPVLIIRGERDPIVPRAWVEHLSRQTPHVTVHEIAHAAHVVQFTKPEELLTVCRPFLDA